MSNDPQDPRAVPALRDRQPWLPYLAAAVLSAVAIGMRAVAAGPVAVAGPVYIVLVVPIGLAAYFGGFGPGLLSTALVTAGAELVLLEPLGGLQGAPLRMRLGLLMLAIVGVLVSIVARQLHSARALAAGEHHDEEHAAALSERDQRLEHLQGRLEQIVATAPGVIYAFRRRPDGSEGFTYASPGSASLLGVPFEDLERDTGALFARMDPGDAAEGARLIDVSAQDLTPWRHQFRMRRPDGEERWIEAHSIPSREPDGGTLWHGFMSDITARKHAERALEATRDTMEILIEQSPVAIAMFDTRMVFLAASDRWCDQFGYRPDELIGRCLYTVVPEIPEHWRRLHAGAIAGTPWQDDHDQWHFKDGTVHDMRWAIHPWRAESGAIGGVILFAEDVTERHAAERRLAASEQRYRDLVNMSPEAIFLTRESKLVFANPAALAVLGVHALEDVLGRDAAEFLHPDEGAHMRATRERLASDDTLPATQRRLVRRDGSVIHVEVVARPYDDAEGPAIQTVVHDITDRIRQQEALRETSTRFRQLAESIREAFYLADESRMRIRYLSSAAREIFGRPEDEFTAGIGTWRTIIHGADRARVTEVLQDLLRGHPFDLEYRIVRGDGTVRWVRDRASAVRDARGTVIGIAGLVEDVTERRALESQLQQASKVESVGLLAGGIAHDFNNLLTVINGNTELLEHVVEEQPTPLPEALELVHEVRGAGERAAALTRQLLAFSRKQPVEPRPVDVSAVVADTEKMLRRLLGSTVELRTELAPVHAARLDPAQLGQVLVNLAVNARDAMPNGGRLTIQTGEEVVPPRSEWAAEARRVRLTVTDTGEGMPPEVLARVFEPFFTTKGIGRGTGLGLAVVQGIVKQSGGEITVQSTVGLGTRFTLTFPASEQRLDDLTAARTAVGGSETLLVVEDEPLVRRTSVRALRLAGYRVREAECAEDALRILQEPDEVIHLLLTDVMMPGMNGRQLAERAQLINPAIRVLLTSGFTDDAAVRQGVAERTVRLLPKPFSVQALLDAVRQTLDTALV